MKPQMQKQKRLTTLSILLVMSETGNCVFLLKCQDEYKEAENHKLKFCDSLTAADTKWYIN